LVLCKVLMHIFVRLISIILNGNIADYCTVTFFLHIIIINYSGELFVASVRFTVTSETFKLIINFCKIFECKNSCGRLYKHELENMEQNLNIWIFLMQKLVCIQ